MPTPDDVAVIIAVIVVVLVLIIIIVAVVLISFLLYRKLNTPKKGLHTATPVANPNDSMELKYKDLTKNNDTSKEMEANLSTEVVPEQEPVPVPVAVAPMEGE